MVSTKGAGPRWNCGSVSWHRDIWQQTRGAFPADSFCDAILKLPAAKYLGLSWHCSNLSLPSRSGKAGKHEFWGGGCCKLCTRRWQEGNPVFFFLNCCHTWLDHFWVIQNLVSSPPQTALMDKELAFGAYFFPCQGNRKHDVLTEAMWSHANTIARKKKKDDSWMERN